MQHQKLDIDYTRYTQSQYKSLVLIFSTSWDNPLKFYNLFV